jgi:transposase-like protein
MIRQLDHCDAPPTCPFCGTPMTLVRIEPRVASFTELQTFRCFACDDLPAAELEKTRAVRAVVWPRHLH